jgi:thioredoxin domain-containing protein 5
MFILHKFHHFYSIFFHLISMFSVVLLFAVLAAATASSVVTLTTKNFDETVKGSDQGWMLKFYAPWCGHCKKLAPTWDKLAEAADSFGVGSMDCTTGQPICTKYKVRGYPTVKFAKGDKMYAYQGARTVEAFKEFATSSYANAESSEL